MKQLNPRAWMLVFICLVVPLASSAGPLVWHTNRFEAVKAARNSGKLILLLAGRETCGICQYMKYTVCETASIRQVIDANYVCWFSPVDDSTEWYPYSPGLGSYFLPIICVIDPGDPTSYLDRSTAMQSVSLFQDRLLSRLPTTAIAATLRIHDYLIHLRWPRENQVKYRVLTSQDMIQWEFVGALFSGSGAELEYEESAMRLRRFYRVMGFR